MSSSLRAFLSRCGGSRIKRTTKWLGYRYGLCLPPVEGVEIELPLLKRLIDTESPTILEIGCNDGSDTLRLANLFENPTLHCFEPEPRAIRRFRSKIPADHPQITLHEFALSDRDGEQLFFPSAGRESDQIPEGWDSSGTLRRPKNHQKIHPGINFGDPVPVPTRRLDSWLLEQKIECVDFIWMDVQGAEEEVFNGAGEMLKCIKLIYTEYSHQELFEGQLKLRDILKRLPDFTVEYRLATDVILRNTRF